MSGLRLARCWPVIAGLLLSALAGPASAVRGSIVVDLREEQVLHADAAGAGNAPASLAKVMTLYLLLNAIDNGDLDMQQALPVSATAAAQPATRLGLRAGARISVRGAAEALLVRSANDVAVVIAEALAGNEPAFVERMNTAAAALGMQATHFARASGLPAAGARTTARDMALLATRLYQRFGHHEALFASTETRHAGRLIATHNGMLTGYPGAIGLKTGFTCAAGYNTIVVARRDGRTLIGVVLGARSAAQRNARARRLLDAAFAATATSIASLDAYHPGSATGTPAPVLGPGCSGATAAPAHAARHYRARGWSIELEPFVSTGEALRRARELQRRVPGSRPLLLPVPARKLVHRAGLTGMSRANAVAACQRLRASGGYCVVRSPQSIADIERRARLARP